MAGCPWTAMRQTSIPEWIVGGAVALALATLVWQILKPKGKSNTGLPLPPGSMGWPLLGETLDFMRSYSKSRTSSTPSFMQARRKLYGDVYKTRVLGLDGVVVGGPEGQKFVSSHDGKLLESQSLKTIVQRFGPNAVFIVNGEHHKRLRKAMHEPFSLGSLKARISSIESLTLDTLRRWEGKEVNVMQESTKFTFTVILDMVLSLKPGPQVDYLWEQFTVLGDGGISVPIRLPGTTFYKMLQARQSLARHFQEIIDSRRNSKTRSEGADILDSLLKPDPEQKTISDVEIIDNILFVLFAGYDTTALALSSVVRRLFQDQHLWSILQDEHDRILEELQQGDSEIKPLTWDSLKQMTHTTQTMYEAVRTSHIGDSLARIARQDLEFQGYRIPKGWTVFLDRDSANVDTRTFEEPEKFNPARFEAGFPSTVSWAPFGNGPHMCLGMELAKLELSVFIHHLVTKYRWRILTDDFSLDYGRAMPRYRSGIPTVFERRL